MLNYGQTNDKSRGRKPYKTKTFIIQINHMLIIK